MAETIDQEAPGTAMTAAEAELAKRALAMKKNIQIATNNIQVTKSGKYKLPGGEEVDEILGVIVDYRYRNQHFPKAYQKGVFTPADCFAIGESPGSMCPHEEAPHPYNDNCKDCDQNKFGSALNGGRGKACQNQFLIGFMFPDLDESEEIFVIKASPTAARAAASYVSNMADQSGHPIKVVTKFTVEVGEWPKVKAQFHGVNPNWEQHFGYMDLAARVLESVPKNEEKVKDTAVDSAAVRGDSGRTRD